MSLLMPSTVIGTPNSPAAGASSCYTGGSWLRGTIQGPIAEKYKYQHHSHAAGLSQWYVLPLRVWNELSIFLSLITSSTMISKNLWSRHNTQEELCGGCQGKLHSLASSKEETDKADRCSRKTKSVVTDSIGQDECLWNKHISKCQLACIRQFLNHKIPIALSICIMLSFLPRGWLLRGLTKILSCGVGTLEEERVLRRGSG